MSELSELKSFRRKLVKARGYVEIGWKADGPLIEAGLRECDCQIVMPNGDVVTHQDSRFFAGWCLKRGLDEIRAMYTNSIAALDARIAKLQEGK